MVAGRGLFDYEGGETETETDTQDIRIIAVFVILVAGLLGGLVPLFVKVL